jgi:gallate dioxygenase
MLEKLGATVGVSNLHFYAVIRGESIHDFLKTRNTQVLYLVTGNEAAKAVTWRTED